MGNITGKQVGNFQANVGTVSADIGVYASYITAGILTLIAIGLAITSFIPMKPFGCDDNPIDQSEKVRCSKKSKNLWLLWFLLLIPLAVLIVFGSKWWDKFVHHNKTAAQIGGTMFELNTLKDFIKN
jgi:hypothetical protein